MSIFAIAMRQLFITLLICVVSAIGADAQIVDLGQEKINTDSLRRELDNGPYFTLYKDNYFITGTSIGPQTPSRRRGFPQLEQDFACLQHLHRP